MTSTTIPSLRAPAGIAGLFFLSCSRQIDASWRHKIVIHLLGFCEVLGIEAQIPKRFG
jgi:hypothetical protein